MPSVPQSSNFRAPVLADLYRAGVLDEVAAASYTNVEAVWDWRKLDGTLLASMHWGLLKDDPNPRFHSPFAFQLGQHLLAGVLTKICNQYPTTKVLFGHTLTGLTQDEKGVTLTIARKDQEDLKLHADYVVGADGGRSATRKLIGQRLEGFTWNETFVAMNVHFPFIKYGWGEANFLVGGMKWAVAGRSGPDGNPWRVAFGFDQVGLTDEEILELAPKRLKEILPGDEPFEIVQAAQYRVHQRQVQNYKTGRVILMGDAAHLNNPMGGFGLTTGLTDAGCMAEALSMVVRGEKEESFLQAACDVRHKLFQDISNPGSQRFKRLVQEDPNNIPKDDMDFFTNIRDDQNYEVNALRGIIGLYTPVEDVQALIDAGKV
jgi:2-polyprenyl-6-methoxyphenol hydroxylase-like FAD-dependent oxidoreductase